MNEDRSNDLTGEEREAFRSLAETRFHSTKEEDRIVKILRKRRLLQSSSPPAWRLFVRLAAAAAALIGAFFLGAVYGSRAAHESEPGVDPFRETGSPPSELMVTKYYTESQPIFPDYRDEPDRPDDGNALFAKVLDQ